MSERASNPRRETMKRNAHILGLKAMIRDYRSKRPGHLVLLINEGDSEVRISLVDDHGEVIEDYISWSYTSGPHTWGERTAEQLELVKESAL